MVDDVMQQNYLDFENTSAQDAQEARDETQKEIASTREKLKGSGLSTYLKQAHAENPFERESNLSAIPAGLLVNSFKQSFAQDLQAQLPRVYMERGSAGAIEIIGENEGLEAKQTFLAEMRNYDFSVGNVAKAAMKELGMNEKTRVATAQKNILASGLVTSIAQQISTGERFLFVSDDLKLVSENEFAVGMNDDALLHMLFGCLISGGKFIRGTAGVLGNTPYGRFALSILRGESFSADMYFMNKRAKGELGVYYGEYIRRKSGFLIKNANGEKRQGYLFVINKSLFPIKKTDRKTITDIKIAGSFALGLTGLYPILVCANAYAKKHNRTLVDKNGKPVTIGLQNQYKFFKALQFSDRNQKAIGITAKDFDMFPIVRYAKYNGKDAQNVRLGAIATSELFGHDIIDYDKEGNPRPRWSVVRKRIDFIIENLYGFLNEANLFPRIIGELNNTKGSLQLPIEAIFVAGSNALDVRTVDIRIWQELMKKHVSDKKLQ